MIFIIIFIKLKQIQIFDTNIICYKAKTNTDIRYEYYLF